ncbi:MAG TPA: hypothetical protein VEV21_03505 [Burkholderiales bacterium]|nr:hypothetical protein [Burkholderiales bacterium]
MKNDRTKSVREPWQIVEQAEKLLGTKRIAEGLKVGEDVVKSWCEGTGTLSDSHLLRLADLLAQYAAGK